MPRRRRSRRDGGIAVEQLAALALVGMAGFAGMGALGVGIARDIAADVPTMGAANAVPMATSAQAGVLGEAAVVLKGTLSAAEKAAVRESPLGAHLALPKARAWREAVTYFMGKRIADGRALGENTSYAFERFLGVSNVARSNRVQTEFLGGLGLLTDGAAGIKPAEAARGAYLNSERFLRMVHSNLFDLFRETGAKLEVGVGAEDGAAFHFEGSRLVVHGDHPLFDSPAPSLEFSDDFVFKDPTDAVMDQVLQRFALHLLEEKGAPPEAAYALHDWIAASEKLQTSATRRIALEEKLTDLEKDLVQKTGRIETVTTHNEAYENYRRWSRYEAGSTPSRAVAKPESVASLMGAIDAVERSIAARERGLAALNRRIARLHADELAAKARFDAVAKLTTLTPTP